MASRLPFPRQQILLTVGKLTICTIDQANRLHHSSASYSYTSELLKGLEDDGYLRHTSLNIYEKGNGAKVYRLSTSGFRYVTQTMRADRSQLIQPSRVQISQKNLLHSVESIDVAVKALELARWCPEVEVRIESEFLLHRKPIPLAGGDFAPDAWVQIRQNARTKTICVEVDLSSEGSRMIENKVANYIEVDRKNSTYFERFGTNQQLCIWATTDRRRLTRLVKIVQEQVPEDNVHASLFLFGVITKDWRKFFLEPYWLSLYGGEFVALLPKENLHG